MRSLSSASVLSITAALALAGCASPVEVRVDPGADFDRYRTWDWLPGTALVIHAPDDEAGLAELRLARGIVRELTMRGFQRARERPDLRVSVMLAVQPGMRLTRRTGAVESVYTFHDGTSYEVQASRTIVERFDHFRLEVYVSEDRGRVIWHGKLGDQVSGSSVLRLDASLHQLLADFPSLRVLASSSRPGAGF